MIIIISTHSHGCLFRIHFINKNKDFVQCDKTHMHTHLAVHHHNKGFVGSVGSNENKKAKDHPSAQIDFHQFPEAKIHTKNALVHEREMMISRLEIP